MTWMPAAGPLAVAETDQIAALLAEVTGRTAVGVMPAVVRRPSVGTATSSPPKAVVVPALDSQPIGARTTLNIRGSVRQMLERANWRNEAPGREEPKLEIPESKPEVGPLPAPFGVLTVATLFGLVNWRNRPDEVQPLPIIKPPPPPGAEFTVAAMMPTFGWE